MAYQNVGTPRFYVNAYEFARAFGDPGTSGDAYTGYEFIEAWDWATNNTFDSIFHTLPSQIYSADDSPDYDDMTTMEQDTFWINNQPLYNFPPHNEPLTDSYNNNFVAFLAHNMNNTKITFNLASAFASPIVNINLSPPIIYVGSLYKQSLQGHTNGGQGAEGEMGNFVIPYSGFTIIGFSHLVPTMWNIDYSLGDFKVGSVMCGSYYDMESSPNLSINIEYDYGKIKETTTRNGSSISNRTHNKPPMWGSSAAWELTSGESTHPEHLLARSGRRKWDLKFSFMGDDNLWGSNQMFGRHREDFTDGLDKTDIGRSISNYKLNLITDDNFFSQVWYKTFGGTLPFIFQPDKDNNNPDQFAICKFKENSLKATQTAFNVYDISLSIEEVW